MGATRLVPLWVCFALWTLSCVWMVVCTRRTCLDFPVLVTQHLLRSLTKRLATSSTQLSMVATGFQRCRRALLVTSTHLTMFGSTQATARARSFTLAKRMSTVSSLLLASSTLTTTKVSTSTPRSVLLWASAQLRLVLINDVEVMRAVASVFFNEKVSFFLVGSYAFNEPQCCCSVIIACPWGNSQMLILLFHLK